MRSQSGDLCCPQETHGKLNRPVHVISPVISPLIIVVRALFINCNKLYPSLDVTDACRVLVDRCGGDRLVFTPDMDILGALGIDKSIVNPPLVRDSVVRSLEDTVVGSQMGESAMLNTQQREEVARFFEGNSTSSDVRRGSGAALLEDMRGSAANTTRNAGGDSGADADAPARRASRDRVAGASRSGASGIVDRSAGSVSGRAGGSVPGGRVDGGAVRDGSAPCVHAPSDGGDAADGQGTIRYGSQVGSGSRAPSPIITVAVTGSVEAPSPARSRAPSQAGSVDGALVAARSRAAERRRGEWWEQRLWKR